MALSDSTFNNFLKDVDRCARDVLKRRMDYFHENLACREETEEEAVENAFNTTGNHDLEEELDTDFANYIARWCQQNYCHDAAALTFRFTGHVFAMEKERFDEPHSAIRAIETNNIGVLYNLYAIFRGQDELASSAFDEFFAEHIHCITILQSHFRRRQAHIALIRTYFE